MLKSKVHSVGYNAVADDTGLVAFQMCEITRNSPKIRTVGVAAVAR